MYTREEILNKYEKVDFPKSLFDEYALGNKNILFYPESKPPSSSNNKDITNLSQSYVLPRKFLNQKKYNINNNSNNKIEFSRGSNFTPNIPKEPTIDIKIENFKGIYDKFSIPLDIKLIYLKSNNNISGPFNYEELESMYKNKKFDSNYEFKTIDLFNFSEEDLFNFNSIKIINEDNWAEGLIDSPLLEYTELFSKVKELLEATKKRKLEINELNDEITELRFQNDEKDFAINELKKEVELLKKELSAKNLLIEEREKEKQKNKEEDTKEEDEKEEDKKEEAKENNRKEGVEIIEIEKKILYNDNDEEEKEEIVEEKIEIIQPKILDTGGEWEIAGKKKKKVEKVKEEPKTIMGISSKKSGDVKNNTDSLIKFPGNNKASKNKNKTSGEDLVEMLKPKKKEIPKVEGELSTTEFKEVKGKGKKKNKKQFESTNVSLGFKY